MEELLTTFSLSQGILVWSTPGILRMQRLKCSSVMRSTHALDVIKSLEKVLASTVFCLLLYQMMGALFKKNDKSSMATTC